ncbi:MAG: hypothetical protein ABI140_18135 [Jatrophihabitantaceae bacterium]
MDEPALSYELFEQRVNKPFTLVLPGEHEHRTVAAVLTECVRARPAGGTSGFSLTFKAGPDAPIEQSTYLLSADGLAPAPIFLVPRRQLPDGLEYLAVFTHLDEG